MMDSVCQYSTQLKGGRDQHNILDGHFSPYKVTFCLGMINNELGKKTNKAVVVIMSIII